MLSTTLASRIISPKRALLSLSPGYSRVKSRSVAQTGPQKRQIFYTIRSVWQMYGPRKKLNTEFSPSNSEVRFTKHNVWARSGPEPNTLLFGITEQAKDLLRPYGELKLQYKLGDGVPESWKLGVVRFYHPDDVEKNRPDKEILEWPLKMTVYGELRAFNPTHNQTSLLAPDPLYNNWILCISGVYQWDWNSLLTTQEYLDYVERTPNLLQMQWRASLYADINNVTIFRRSETPNPDKLIRESIEKQVERDEKRNR